MIFPPTGPFGFPTQIPQLVLNPDATLDAKTKNIVSFAFPVSSKFVVDHREFVPVVLMTFGP
jgi:hypothetical protein